MDCAPEEGGPPPERGGPSRDDEEPADSARAASSGGGDEDSGRKRKEDAAILHAEEETPPRRIKPALVAAGAASSPSSPGSRGRTVRFDPGLPSPAGGGPPSRRPTPAKMLPPRGGGRKLPVPYRHPEALPKGESPTKFGKGKVNPVRDAGLVAAFFAFFLYMTKDVGRPPTPPGGEPAAEQKKPSIVETMEHAANSINGLTDAFASLAQQQYAKMKGRPGPCGVFVSPSSLPGAGPGLFAGRDYEEGEVVPLSPALLLPPPRSRQPDDGKSQNAGYYASPPWIPIPAFTGASANENNWLWVPPHALLLKHHPALANVNGTLFLPEPPSVSAGTPGAAKEPHPLVATRRIPAGSELFAGVGAHPHGRALELQVQEPSKPLLPRSGSARRHPLFGRIPTAADYEMADRIWDDADRAHRATQASHRLAQIQSGAWYKAMAQAVSRIDPVVGALLPSHQPRRERATGSPLPGRQTARERATQPAAAGRARSAEAEEADRELAASSLWSSLLNQTEAQLKVKGSCLADDVAYGPGAPRPEAAAGSDAESAASASSCSAAGSARGDAVPVAGRAVKKGSVLTRIPLLAALKEEHEGIHHSDSHAPRFGDELPSSRLVLYPLVHPLLVLPRAPAAGAPGESDASATRRPNLEVRWTEAPWHASSRPRESSIGQVLELPPGSLVWDVVALAHVAEGEELVVEPSALLSLFPEHWMGAEQDESP